MLAVRFCFLISRVVPQPSLNRSQLQLQCSTCQESHGRILLGAINFSLGVIQRDILQDGLDYSPKIPEIARMMEYELARTQTVATVAWGPHSTRMFEHFLVDRRTALMVGWTEKAGCTGAVTSLLRHMHLLGHAMKYSPWVHHYRQDKFHTEYGNAQAVEIMDRMSQPMTRIKFVRNPYQRVISSYVACLPQGFLKDVLSLYQTRMAFTAQQFNVTDITFEQFLDALSWLLDNNLYDRVQEHAGFQVTPFEAGFAAIGEPLFDCIYQIEHDNSEVVDQLFQTSFAFNTLAPHATKRQSQNQNFYRKSCPTKQRVMILEGGFRGWEAHDLPIQQIETKLSQKAADQLALKIGKEVSKFTR